jgi:cyanophycin synthetase
LKKNSTNNLRGSTRIMYNALSQRVPVQIIDAEKSLFSYEDTKGETHLMFSTTSDKSSAIGIIIAGNKSKSATILEHLSIPRPKDRVCNTIIEAIEFLNVYKKVVVKPTANSGGKGVSTAVVSVTELRRAYKFAKLYGQKVIVQHHLDGTDLRLLIVGGKFVSAVSRIPAGITGDGIRSIAELIAQENSSERRNNPANLSLLHIDKTAAKRYLGGKLQKVPKQDEIVRVVGPANVSLGGELQEATHLVTSNMIADAEKITNALQLGICGVDMIWDQKLGTYGIIEVNATPGIDIHNDPFSGTSSDAAEKYADWLIA